MSKLMLLLITSATTFSSRCYDISKVADQIYNNISKFSIKSTIPNQNLNNPISILQKRLKTASFCSKPTSSNHVAATLVTSQFTTNEIERRYYKVLCSLAHSQWSCQPAVKFSKQVLHTALLVNQLNLNVMLTTFL
uniref:Uncharacterized protein n=1 Tax=Arundo donax TaxID=35708 RepID=A0A0A9C8E6_ARUDO